jgi:DNA-binding Lrp family transcriptional regulator
MDQILDILEKNARTSISDLAKLTGKTKKEVERYIKKMERKGVIVKYKAILNKRQVQKDKGVQALIEVSLSPQKNVGFDYVAERIYRFPEVKSCYLLSGSYDLLVVVEGEDIHTVADFVASKLASLEHIQGTTTHFLLKRYKEDGVVFKKDKSVKRLAITY